MDISIEQVKKLREKTGAGISDCKKALIESNGDFEKAIEYLRKKGAATSQKRSDRIAKEGLIVAKTNQNRTEAAIAEINCETDFVARSDSFRKLSDAVVDVIFESKTEDLNKLISFSSAQGNIQNLIDQTTASVGEKIEIKRIGYMKSEDGFFCEYNHLGNKVASIVELKGNISEKAVTLGNDIAMQVVAMKPLTINRNGISNEMIEKEKEIYAIQAKNEGKPDKIAEKIAANKIEKFYEENCLEEQEFIKEPGKNVSDIIKSVSNETGIEYSVKFMLRFQLGETLGM